MENLIELLKKIITNVLTALYQPFWFAVILTVFLLFFYLYAYKPIDTGKGIRAAFRAWWQELVTEKIDSKVVNIATVGRVSKEKGQEMIPSVIKMLQDRGVKVFWYIVGDGDDLDRIKEISCEYGVADSICFVGSKSNPYPYMKMCDIYVQPSYTEGYCLTVCEAAILGKPIVLTEIAAAEILENGKTAIVVKPNINSITDGIEKLIFQPEIKRNLIKNLAELDLSNSQEIDKLLRII